VDINKALVGYSSQCNRRADPNIDASGGTKGLFEQFVKKRLAIQIAYRSLYEERWRLTYSQGQTTIDQRPAGGALLDAK
jgi:hypothetical protein